MIGPVSVVETSRAMAYFTLDILPLSTIISVMTETSANSIGLDDLPLAIKSFVLRWGDMGGQWGVNRTVAQIHALLYITERPLNAEEIAATLGVARSNVSNSLKELQNWKIIERVPVSGDRRDFFIAQTDTWEMATRIAAVRKEREFDPALRTLAECLMAADGDRYVSDVQRDRLQALYDFTGSIDNWHSQILRLPASTLSTLVKMGDRVVSLLGLGPKKAG
jgi:DNA-binding transcriptional regulator GbsR (MarR family)